MAITLPEVGSKAFVEPKGQNVLVRTRVTAVETREKYSMHHRRNVKENFITIADGREFVVTDDFDPHGLHFKSGDRLWWDQAIPRRRETLERLAAEKTRLAARTPEEVARDEAWANRRGDDNGSVVSPWRFEND